MQRNAVFCGVFLCGGFLASAVAQQSMSNQMSVSSNQSVMTAIMQPVANAQYQAEKVSRSVQTLSDGTVITHETRGLIARDAEGRMREDINMVQSGQAGGHQLNMALQSATVGDPVSHSMLLWSGDKLKLAMRMQLPSLPAGARKGMLGGSPAIPRVNLGTGSNNMPSVLEAQPPPVPPAVQGKSVSPVLLRHDDARTEDLGKQSIEGVLVTGERTTTTIATGKIGNDRPIIVVHEEWRSPELKIVVKTIDTDPRTGVQTMELTNLNRSDPDPALFQAPAGYDVKDMSEMLKTLGSVGKTAQ